MLRLLEIIAKEQFIGNIADATIINKNKNGTYDIKLKGGGIKRRIKNISTQSFSPGTSITIILPHGKGSNVRILGKGIASTKASMVVNI